MRMLFAMSLCALTVAAASAQNGSGDARAEAAVRAVVASYVDAREKQDAAAIGALFTDDADQFNSSGEWRRGREAIVKGTLQSSQRNPVRGTSRSRQCDFRRPASRSLMASTESVNSASGPRLC